MVDFSRVIAVRNRKLSNRRNAERQSMMACDTARDAVESSQQAMSAYSDEIKSLELELISRLMKTRITRQDINDLNAALERASQKADQLVKNHKDAAQALEKAEKIVEEKRKERVELQARLHKIKEINRKIVAQKDTLASKAQDAAMDEFLDTINGRRNQ